MTMLQRAAAIFRPGGSGAMRDPQMQQTSGGLIFLKKTSSGQYVNEMTAMRLTAVYRSLALRSIPGMLPLQVFERTADNERQTSRLPIDSYLWGRPNPEQEAVEAWSFAFRSLALGNCYLYIVDQLGLPSEVWPLESKRVKVGRTSDGEKVYEIDGKIPERGYRNGGAIVHVMGQSRNGLYGESPIQLAEEAIGLAMSAEDYAAQTFDQGSAPGGTLTTDQPLTRAQADALRDRWNESHAGVRNANKIAVLDRNLKYAAVSLSPRDAETLESRKYGVTEVARLFGVPPHLVGDVEKSTSWGTGIEEQTLNFLTFTLQRDIIGMEQAITDELLWGTKRYVKFNIKALLRSDAASRATFYDVMTRIGAMSKDDVRAAEDMNPIPDGAGAVYLTPLNMGAAGMERATGDARLYLTVMQLVDKGFEPDAAFKALGLEPIPLVPKEPVPAQLAAPDDDEDEDSEDGDEDTPPDDGDDEA